jgi:VanZ family protein
VADEYRQSFISTRFASAGDVLLDLVGIVLSMVLILRLFKTKVLVTADAPDDRR